jgi:NAD(P)-dependent dehydrogenase (short-subunit alcohol dehydrogenase family)
MTQAWFISGANRGIGLELVKIAVDRGYIVFAGVRTTSKAVVLNNLAAKNPNVHIVKLESVSVSDAHAAAEVVEQVTGGLDVVIANAGIANNWQPVTEIDLSSLNDHYQVNAVGPIILFQALYPLLAKRQTRKFVTVSTMGASIERTIPVPSTVYGSSKAALNYITRSIHKEHSPEGFVVFPIHPEQSGRFMSYDGTELPW